MSLLPFFEWCEASAVGEAIRSSLWLFPVIECVHLFGLVTLGGAVLLVDVRLLGFGLRDQPIDRIGREAHRWMLVGLMTLVATGVPLFLSEAVKCYYSTAFWTKILTLVPALVYALTVRRRVVTAGERVHPIGRGLTALVSLGSWFTVAASGRWIGFS